MLLKEKCGSENQGLGIGSRVGGARSGLPWRFDAGRKPDHESGGAASRPHGAAACDGSIEGQQDRPCAAERQGDPERPLSSGAAREVFGRRQQRPSAVRAGRRRRLPGLDDPASSMSSSPRVPQSKRPGLGHRRQAHAVPTRCWPARATVAPARSVVSSPRRMGSSCRSGTCRRGSLRSCDP